MFPYTNIPGYVLMLNHVDGHISGLYSGLCGEGMRRIRDFQSKPCLEYIQTIISIT